MKLKLSFAGGLFCLMAASNISAVTLVEIREGEHLEMREGEHSTSTLYVEGAQMRTDTPGEASYAVMDLVKHTLVIVNTSEKTAMDMSSMAWKDKYSGGGTKPRKVNADLEKIGSGPTIAGYRTIHYTLSVDGKKCKDMYTSMKVLKDIGWADLWSDIGSWFREASIDDADDCELAEYQVADPGKLGFPLKTVESDGQFDEVTNIEQGVKLPPGGFEVPAGYKLVSFEEMMSGMNWSNQGDMGMDEDSFADESDADYQDYDEEQVAEEDTQDQDFVEELGEDVENEAKDVVKDKLKGFMNKFRKKKDNG